MGAYSRLKPDARTIVDTVFTGITEKDLVGMGLPKPMELERRIKILYPGSPGVWKGVHDDYKVCAAVRKMGKSLSSVKIGEQIGRSDSVIREWLKGSRSGEFRRLSDIHEHRIPTGKSIDFAKFLGFVLSTRGRHSKRDSLEFGSTDGTVLKEFDDTIQRLWGYKCEDIRDEHGKVVGKLINSREVKNSIEFVTNGWTTLPWEHLVEKEERHAFLRAWFSKSSNMRTLKTTEGRENVVMEIHKRFEGGSDPRLGLFNDLRVLLLDSGFGNTMVKHGGSDYAIRIHDMDDLQRLANENLSENETGYFIQEEKRTGLNNALKASSVLPKESNTRHDYYLLRKLVSNGMNVKEAAEKFRLHLGTASNWIRGTQKPTAVKWDDEVKELKKKRKPDEIGYAFRNITQDPTEARKLALENNMEQLKAIKTRRDIEKLIRDSSLPLLPGEYWPLTSWKTLEEAKRFIESKRPELLKRMGDIKDRLMQADEQTVLKIMKELPNHEVYERSLLHARSNKAALPFTTLSLDQIAMAVARQPMLVNEILEAPIPKH